MQNCHVKIGSTVDIYKILSTKYVDRVHMEKAAESIGDLRPKRIKIRELSADTIDHLAERLRDKLRAWVRILASVRFSVCSVGFFLL